MGNTRVNMDSVRIVDETSMNLFCELANSIKSIHGIDVHYIDDFLEAEVEEMEAFNLELIQEGMLGKTSHLMQGISRIDLGIENDTSFVSIAKTPFLYPAPQILEHHLELTGPMTGNLQCCIDFDNDGFLYHMRGKKISEPYGFQAASAGMQDFNTTLYEGSLKELSEEAGIVTVKPLFGQRAVSFRPFMKGGQIPQPLTTYAFEADLSGFEKYNSIKEVEDFEARTKKALEDGDIQNQEAFPFAVPISFAEPFAEYIADSKRQYGPICQSVKDTLDMLDRQQI